MIPILSYRISFTKVVYSLKNSFNTLDQRRFTPIGREGSKRVCPHCRMFTLCTVLLLEIKAADSGGF